MKFIRKYFKEPFIFVFCILMMLGNTPLYANYSDFDKIEVKNDYIALNDGTIIQGEIVKFGSNSFRIINNEGKIKINNDDISIISFGQELTDEEKYRLGILDGKRYAKRKGGNVLLGFFFGLLGTGIVYLTSSQYPTFEASIGSNKTIIGDSAYVAGFEKGARQRSGGNALIGTAAWVVLVAVTILDTGI